MKKSLLLAALIVGVVSVVMNPMFATGHHEPADKASAAANDLDRLRPAGSYTVLRQTMRVSSTSDLILQTTAECSILTSLLNPGSAVGGASDTQGAFGQVEMWITLDGKRVPVATNDAERKGEVVFCNRAYGRTITDREENEGGSAGGDGYDAEDDFIRTRTANGFNWMAFNVGKEYDAGGDNIIEIRLRARYTKEANGSGVATGGPDCPDEDSADDSSTAPLGQTCAEAFVGSRTLIAEAVHASNHEQVDNNDE